MEAKTVERYVFMAVVAYLQWQVLQHGHTYSSKVAAAVQLPGLRRDPLWAGRLNDLSDVQWRDFRAALGPLAGAMAAFVALSRLARTTLRGGAPVATLALTLAVLGVLHGYCAVCVLALAALNFALAQRFAGTRLGLPMPWLLACSSLLLARLTDGLPFARISPLLAPLDSQRGMLRWHIHYNLLVLRMISYAVDLHWARTRLPVRPPSRGKHKATSASAVLDLELKVRVQAHLQPQQYNLVTYLSYLFYPPLYIAGPIITYNSFASQLQAPLPQQRLSVLRYCGRFLLAWLSLEVLTHTLYYNSIAKHRVLDYGARAGLLQARPAHYAYAGYWVLVFMWLKFTVIWRFFRLFALADGIVPPENMTRCVCNNYDIEGFWKNWHASYNQWLVRYMYVPLGGAQWRVLNVWAIFTFVALWHDLEWRLLGWAWLMAAAIAPEVAVKALGRSSWMRGWHGTAAFRHAAAAAAAANILLLMAGNLVGFVVGLDGIGPLVKQVLGQPSFLAVTLAALFSAAHLMFWKRETEWQQEGQG